MLPVKSVARSLTMPLWLSQYLVRQGLAFRQKSAAAASYLSGNPLRLHEFVHHGLELVAHTIGERLSLPLDPCDVVGRRIVEILVDRIGVLLWTLPKRDVEPIMRRSSRGFSRKTPHNFIGCRSAIT